MYQVQIDCCEIHSKIDFMKAMDSAFRLPPYFGENWDALWECMNDLYWINDERVELHLLNFNDLVGKLKFEVRSFFEDLTAHLEESNNSVKLTVRFTSD